MSPVCWGVYIPNQNGWKDNTSFEILGTQQGRWSFPHVLCQNHILTVVFLAKEYLTKRCLHYQTLKSLSLCLYLEFSDGHPISHGRLALDSWYLFIEHNTNWSRECCIFLLKILLLNWIIRQGMFLPGILKLRSLGSECWTFFFLKPDCLLKLRSLSFYDRGTHIYRTLLSWHSVFVFVFFCHLFWALPVIYPCMDLWIFCLMTFISISLFGLLGKCLNTFTTLGYLHYLGWGT